MPVLTYPADVQCACGSEAVVVEDGTPFCAPDYTAHLRKIKSTTDTPRGTTP